MTPARSGTVAIVLPAAERFPISAALAEAGLDPIGIDDADALASLVSVSDDLVLAIIGADTLDEVVALRDVLSAATRPVPALVVVGEDELEAAAAIEPRPGIEDDLLVRPLDGASIRWRAEAMLIRARTDDAASDGALRQGALPAGPWGAHGRLFVVFSPKGGVGKTTLATNLAATFQSRQRRTVVLVDADTVTGHVATSLAMDDVRTVADSWADEASDGVAEHALDIAAVHESGIRVVALTNEPLHADALDPDRVVALVDELRAAADVVVVDTHPSYGALNLALFRAADRILFPVTPDISAIRAGVHFHDVAMELGVIDRIAMVVNRAESGVSTTDLERTIGLPAIAGIRSAGRLVVAAANEGRTVVDRYPKEKITDDFEALAERLLPSPAGASAKTGLRAMFGKRAAAGA